MMQSEGVRNYFSRAASTFDALYAERRMSPFKRFVNRHFRRDIYERFLLTMEHFKTHGLKSALDVGCGSGRYAVSLADLGVERILGIDFSPAMIELARTYAQEAAATRCEFACADFTAFETEERFDGVIAMGVFDYFPEPLPVLARMRELARHSVVASFPSVNLYRTPIRKLRYRIKRCPVYFYDRRAIDELVRSAGFSRHEITKIRGAGMDYFIAMYV